MTMRIAVGEVGDLAWSFVAESASAQDDGEEVCDTYGERDLRLVS